MENSGQPNQASRPAWGAYFPEVILLVSFACLYFLKPTLFQVDGYAELFHMAAARQSLHTGHFWIPFLQGHPYLIRAPFWTWMLTAAFAVAGPSLMVARSVSIIFTLIGLILTYLVGVKLTNNRISGLFSAALLGTAWGCLHWGSLSSAAPLLMDMHLAFLWVLLDWQEKARRRHTTAQELEAHSTWLGVFLGLVVLTQSLFSAFFLVMMAGFLLGFSQELYLIERINPVRLLGAFLLVIVPWLLGAAFALHHPMLPLEILFIQPVQRMLGLGAWHTLHWDALFYLKQILVEFFPMLLFIPAAFLHALSPTHPSFQANSIPVRNAPFFLPTWFLLGFLMLTFSVFQEPSQLLAFYPALALWIGHYLSEATEGFVPSNSFQNSLVAYILGVMLVAVIATLVLFQVFPNNYIHGFWHFPGPPLISQITLKGHLIDLPEGFPIWKFWLLPGALILLLSGMTLFVFLQMNRARGCIYTILATSLLLGLFVKSICLPILDRPIPRLYAQAINKLARPNDTVVLVSFNPAVKQMLFFLDDRRFKYIHIISAARELADTLSRAAESGTQGRAFGVIGEQDFFDTLDLPLRQLLEPKQAQWILNTSQLGEINRLWQIREPQFNKMKKTILWFESDPLSAIPSLSQEFSDPDLSLDQDSVSEASPGTSSGISAPVKTERSKTDKTLSP